MNNFYTTNIDRGIFDKMTCLSEEKNIPVLFVSLQTTGIEPGEIIQMSVVKTKAVNGQFEVIDTFNNYFRPHILVSQKTEVLTGLNNDILSLYSHIEDARSWFESIFNGEYIIAMYNYQWAKHFLDNLGIEHEVFITPLFWVNIMELAKCTINPLNVTDFRNQTLCELFKIDYSIDDNMIKTSGLVKLANALLFRYQTKYLTSHKAYMPNVLNAKFIRREPLEGVNKIEINTDNGKLYLMCNNYSWTDEDGISIQFLDVDRIEKYILEKTGSSDLKSFVQKVRKDLVIQFT